MRAVMAVVACCLLIAADPKADPAKKELERLQGEWSLASGSRNGKTFPDNALKLIKRTTEDDVTTVTYGRDILTKGTFTLDPSKTPKAIDVTLTVGPDKEKVQHGIYEVDGDTMKLCLAEVGKERPTEFATKEGDGHTLGVWKRVKQ